MTNTTSILGVRESTDATKYHCGGTYTTAEPTHEPHPHFGSINGEHIEIVPVNMNFLAPPTFAKIC